MCVCLISALWGLCCVVQWYSSAMGITLPDLQSASKEDLMEAADDITKQSAVQRAAVAVAQNVTVAVGPPMAASWTLQALALIVVILHL